MNGVRGCRRFLDRVWRIQEFLTDDEGISSEMERNIHKTIRKVSEDYETLKYNTAIAAMMSLVNDFYAAGRVTRGEMKVLLILLNPVAPHITEELWSLLDKDSRLIDQKWPEWDESKTVEDMVEIAVQINGKVRGRMVLAADATQEEAKSAALEDEKIKSLFEGRNIVKVIYVPGRILNVVVK